VSTAPDNMRLVSLFAGQLYGDSSASGVHERVHMLGDLENKPSRDAREPTEQV
jgi:hypothetical protein